MPVLDGFGGMHDGWGWLAGGAMMLLVWGLIIWGAVYFWRRSEPRHAETRDGPAGRDASAILRERFARGEISEEEFTARLSALRRADGAQIRSP